MAYRDQQKYIEGLKKHERNLDPREADEFKMFVKMHKDEEEFDSVSFVRLQELYEKYNVPVDKSKFDAYFKKKA
jgi:hypothetical protein